MAAAYSASVEPGSDDCFAAVRSAQSGGIGSHVAVPGGEKPYGGSAPCHGSGTRQPSLPRMVCPDRDQTVDVVVAEHPGRCCADRTERVRGLLDRMAVRRPVPSGEQQPEVEGQMELVRAHILSDDGRV